MLWSAQVNGTGAAFEVGAVRKLYETRPREEGYLGYGVASAYAASADGQRFLTNMVSEDVAAASPIRVVTNWTASLH